MSHRLNSFIALTMMAAASCCAMEKQSPLKELTITTNPRQALYLTDNRLVISDEQGCRIIDPTTNKEIKKISNASFPYIAIHPNKKKLALSYGDVITIYDGEIGLPEKSFTNPLKESSILASIFSPTDDIIFMSHTSAVMTGLKYKEDTFFIARQSYQKHPPRLALHPTQKKRVFAENPGHIFVYDEDNNELKIIFPLFNNYKFCAYSPDGSRVAAGNQDDIFILDPNNEIVIFDYHHTLTEFSLPKDTYDKFIDMAFHPNSSVLVTLSSPSNVVRYWDVLKRQLIKKMNPLIIPQQDYPRGFVHYQHLSFAPNGKKLMLIVDDKCGSMPVPFEAIYQTNAIKIVLPIYWALKQYHLDQYTTLPNDITYVIMHTLLAMLKR